MYHYIYGIVGMLMLHMAIRVAVLLWHNIQKLYDDIDVGHYLSMQNNLRIV